MQDISREQFIEEFLIEAGVKFNYEPNSFYTLNNCLHFFKTKNSALKETRAIVNKDRAELREELTQQIRAEIKDEYATKFAKFNAIKDLTIGELVDEYM